MVTSEITSKAKEKVSFWRESEFSERRLKRFRVFGSGKKVRGRGGGMSQKIIIIIKSTLKNSVQSRFARRSTIVMEVNVGPGVLRTQCPFCYIVCFV